MMQDRRALQAGTSHFLGQNFARACGIKFLDQEGVEQHAWTTSWGVSTRLVGGLVMTHGDDDGLVLPPRLAPKHVSILPIYRSDEDRARVLDYSAKLRQALEAIDYAEERIRVEIDDRDLRGGEKTWQHVKRGVPIRLEIGPRDIDQDAVTMARRDQGVREKRAVPREELVRTVAATLDEIQAALFARARELRDRNTHEMTDRAAFEAFFREEEGGFVLAHWSEDPSTVETLRALRVSARCVPLEGGSERGTCIFTGKPAEKRVVFARAY